MFPREAALFGSGHLVIVIWNSLSRSPIWKFNPPGPACIRGHLIEFDFSYRMALEDSRPQVTILYARGGNRRKLKQRLVGGVCLLSKETLYIVRTHF